MLSARFLLQRTTSHLALTALPWTDSSPVNLNGKLPKVGLPSLQWEIFSVSPSHGSLSSSLLASGGISYLPVSSWPPPPLWVFYLLGNIPFSPRLFLRILFSLIHLISHYQKIILCIKTVSLQIPVWFLPDSWQDPDSWQWTEVTEADEGKGLGQDQVFGWFIREYSHTGLWYQQSSCRANRIWKQDHFSRLNKTLRKEKSSVKSIPIWSPTAMT